jgi:hypothetical protein
MKVAERTFAVFMIPDLWYNVDRYSIMMVSNHQIIIKRQAVQRSGCDI